MARIAFFSRRSNPKVDLPDFRISRNEAKIGLANGTLRAVSENPLIVQQTGGMADSPDAREMEDVNLHDSDTSLTMRTMEANVGIAGRYGEPPDVSSVRRAQAKVRFWGQRASWADRVVMQ